jgi:hypothetical protein
LLNLFINDLVEELKKLNIGIEIADEKACVLLYADDVVLLAENETELQLLLNVLNTLCCKNDLEVNYDKSKIVHFRNQSRIVTSKEFHIGDNTNEIVTKYNYLGLVITEFLDYNVMAKAVVMSASRALGLLIAKYKLNGGFIFNTYTTL